MTQTLFPRAWSKNPTKILNPTFSDFFVSHAGKLAWGLKTLLAWGFVFFEINSKFMINKNEESDLPMALRFYQFTVLLIITLLISLPLSLLWHSYFGSLRFFFFFFLIPVFIYLHLADTAVSFIIDDQKITINRGMIFKKSKTILFSNIQNINIKKGPLLRIFGLAGIEIWTASQSQSNTRNEKKSDGYLKLSIADAQTIADIISAKK